MDKALLSSENMNWQTPEDHLALVRSVRTILLDPYTASDNPTKARFYCTPTHAHGAWRDGALVPWATLTLRYGGQVFTNPPYGDYLATFSQKFEEEARKGAEITALVPARTDTAWWNRCADAASGLLLWRGRVKFIDPATGKPRLTYNKKANRWVETPAPFPVSYFYAGPNLDRFQEIFGPYGRFYSTPRAA
jgi:hypothetical protein